MTLFPIFTMENRELAYDVAKGPLGESISFGVVSSGDMLNFYIGEGVVEPSGLLFPAFNVDRSQIAVEINPVYNDARVS
jgi:hypothetical protein